MLVFAITSLGMVRLMRCGRDSGKIKEAAFPAALMLAEHVIVSYFHSFFTFQARHPHTRFDMVFVCAVPVLFPPWHKQPE